MRTTSILGAALAVGAVVLDGYPPFLWQSDAAPGDTTGQGVQGVWWVVAPDGTKITQAAAPAASSGY